MQTGVVPHETILLVPGAPRRSRNLCVDHPPLENPLHTHDLASATRGSKPPPSYGGHGTHPRKLTSNHRSLDLTLRAWPPWIFSSATSPNTCRRVHVYTYNRTSWPLPKYPHIFSNLVKEWPISRRKSHTRPNVQDAFEVGG